MIRVEYSLPLLSWLVYRYDPYGEGQRRWYDSKGGSKVIKNNTDPAPYWLMLDEYDARELVKQLIEADVKPPKHDYQEGELIATKKHLEDMRQLVLLDPPMGSLKERI